MEIQLIQSRQNPRVQRLANLRERKARENEGVFAIEGMREIERALASGIEVGEIYFCREKMRSAAAEKILAATQKNPAIAHFELSVGAMEKASYRDNPEGLIAVAKMRAHTLADLPATRAETAPLYLVAEAIEKPGNLGALLRTADSAGCTALLCCGLVSDAYNPNAVRASQGTLFSMPFASAPAEEIAAWLDARGVKIFATTPAAEKLYWECDFRVPSAILLGAEATGLSDFWLGNDSARAEQIAIPQRGLADSLNVSTAGAICLFEAVRQRFRVPGK